MIIMHHLRTALGALKGYENEQREKIFHLRCTIKGKVCSLIINSGSCSNVASLSLVEKLNLQAIALILITSNGLTKVKASRLTLDVLSP